MRFSTSDLALLLTLFPSLTHAVTHIVSVGYYEYKFSPSSITAAPGDEVEFQFHSGAVDATENNTPHWPAITRGQFGGSPYTPLNGTEGLSSWFLKRQGEFNTWTIQINDTEPIWYYDCDRYGIGMAGVINPPADASQGTAEAWIAENEVLFVRDPAENERCLPSQQGGVLGQKEESSLWTPESEDDTTTVVEGGQTATETGSMTGTAITSMETGSMTGTAIPAPSAPAEDTGSMTGTAIIVLPTSVEDTGSMTTAVETGSMTTMDIPSPSSDSTLPTGSGAPPASPTFTGAAAVVGADSGRLAMLGLMGGLIAMLG